MTRRIVAAVGLVLVFAAPGPAGASEVRLAFKDGKVDLVARDATLREILVEWERTGGTRIVNVDRVPAARLTLDLEDVPEEQALTTLLRPIAGYVASLRVGPGGGPSGYSRVILMPALATPATYAAVAPAQPAGPSRMGLQPGRGGAPMGRPGMQRRVLPDGRIVTVMDDTQQADEPDDTEQERPGANPPGLMRPPFNAPPRPPGQGEGDTPQPEVQPGDATPTTSVMPVVPQTTVVKPGALPVTKPGGPPPPIKPPGD
jgi:hypothetical protein